MNYSPLRYPGGKSRIAPFVKLIIQRLAQPSITYVEPFAGGAGVALSLLLDGLVKQIIINDYDKAIYSFWRVLKEDPLALIELVQNTPITIDEWHKQKEIYLTKNTRYSVELGFSAFFLNRTNRSGILSAGPIGGYGQDGNYTIAARFNREALIERIRNIALHRDKIVVYNKDIRSFIRNVIPRYSQNAFVYFDPPYYTNGRRLYKNSFSPTDHASIAKCIIDGVSCPWIITYDNILALKEIYSGFPQRLYSLNYSAANKGIGSELIIFKSKQLIPPEEIVRECIEDFRIA